MTTRIACILSLLVLGACRSTQVAEKPLGEMVVAVKWMEDERIGAAPGPALHWEEACDSLAATFTARGDAFRVSFAPRDPGTAPERWWWTRGNDEPTGDSDAIPWRTVIPGQLLMASVAISIDPPLQLELRWTQGKVSGTVSQQVVGRAVFDWRGEAHEAWFVDVDLDGALGSAHDRWVAGPASRLAEIKFPNPSVEMRSLEEPWCLGEHGITFRGWKDGAVRLDVGPPLDRSALRSRHAARLLNEFVAKTGVPRSAVLEKQGDSPDRPTTADQAPWVYVDSWEAALAQRLDPNEPLIVEFTSNSCGWCSMLSWLTHEDAEVDRELRRFTRVKVDPQFAVGSFPRQRSKGTPATLLVGSSGEVADVMEGFKPPSAYAETLRAWRERSRE